jgi:hypothetical protein
VPLDRTEVKDEFVEAMRARLEADQPGAGENARHPEVQKNLDALGWAVIRTLTEHAEPFSDAAADAAFWNWATAVNNWLKALSAWQTGVTNAFKNWTPATAAEANLKNAVVGVPAPGAPPAAAPAALKGRVR